MKNNDAGLPRGPGSRQRAGRLYRLFLKAYPPGERERYGPEMEETFLVLLRREGERCGWPGRARAWLAGFFDAVMGGLRARLRTRTRERRERARSLDDLAVYYEDRLNMTGDGSPELVAAVRTSWNVFDLLGREPVLGRSFLEGEMGEGRSLPALLTPFPKPAVSGPGWPVPGRRPRPGGRLPSTCRR